ncbi:hypothetical protein Q4F19_11845 [Sphingomonas sp. BIUV-7]|uniref:Uncharacterized protein n=1 Tax=Sphingomonas natans TaxID=3063330 RepID=A0ABT8Y9S3_9SPHN|nr:hypothetical protein [Sphingomonas sp. BIUV-7]
MVGLTLAIGDFMMLLISAALWTGGGFALIALAGIGALGGLVLLVRRLRR